MKLIPRHRASVRDMVAYLQAAGRDGDLFAETRRPLKLNALVAGRAPLAAHH